MAIGTNFLFLMSIKVHRLWEEKKIHNSEKHVMESAVTADFKRHTEEKNSLFTTIFAFID